jgi:hypothetical protein
MRAMQMPGWMRKTELTPIGLVDALTGFATSEAALATAAAMNVRRETPGSAPLAEDDSSSLAGPG